MNEKDALARAWQELGQGSDEALAQWHTQHPRATFAQIEEQVDRQLAALRAKLIEQMTQHTPLPAAADARCPSCGGRVTSKGTRSRRLKTANEQAVEFERERLFCPACEVGFFPLDERLALSGSALTPRLHEGLVRLGTWMPFARSASLLEYFTGTAVSESSARRWTERAGDDLVAWEEAELERIERELPEPPEGPERALLSSDGAMVPVVGGEWVEVKTLAIGEVVVEDGQARARQMSYFSRNAEANQFIRHALVETHRRGLERAGAVCAVADGAAWNQSLVDHHRADATRILDFGHAAESVTVAGVAAWGDGAAEIGPWAKRQRQRLREGEADGVLRAMKRLRGERSCEGAARPPSG